MGCSEPKKCCCCCELRTGCLVIGYLGAISYGVFALYTALIMPIVIADESREETEIPMAVIILILGIFLCLVYTFLLVGVYKKRPDFLRIASIAIFALEMLSNIVRLCEPTMQDLFGILSALLGVGFVVYLTLCIKAYALSLQDEQYVSQDDL